MAVHVVRLGSPRSKDEGVRLGTVRRPPRGVPKERFAKDDWYDVWLPTLAPGDALRVAYSSGSIKRAAFEKKYRAEMKRPDAAHLLDALAALSRQASFAVGCYCEDETTCHRTVLRQLLEERGATIAD